MLLVCTSVAGLIGWGASRHQIDKMSAQMDEMQRQEKRSAVLRSISNQMEEIAYQQMKISDKQREEAIEQTAIANEMRERSESERQKAIIAQQNALASEQRALEAYEQAEYQRHQADRQRIKAETSKRVADTLSFLALGRSLGAQSNTQFRAGNHEIAAMLSFASYVYTDRYHGDIYYPAIYQSLSQSSRSTTEWPKHEGPISRIEFMPKSNNRLVSVSTYGEVLLHEKSGNNLKTKILFKDKQYDFRDVYVNPANGTIYALSRSSHLIVWNNKGTKIIPLETIPHPFKMQLMLKTNELLIIGEKSIAVFDMDTNTVLESRNLKFRVTCSSRYNYMPMLFDDKGKMYYVETINKFKTKKVPVVGTVTAYASSKGSGYEAYGMSDGTIFLRDSHGNTRRLVGHRSRISFLKINYQRVYSGSYDGSLNLWIATSEKVEPMTLLNVGSWIRCFTFDADKNYVWIGDQKGSLSEALISVPMIIEKVKKQLTRNFSETEWNYYIDENVRYESLMSMDRKEGRP